MNPDAKVLSESAVTNGQTVSLVFDAPNTTSRLIAACVNKDGVYRFKGFDIGDTKVGFLSAKARATRTRAAESSYNFPDANNISLSLKNSFLSYNAMRTFRANEGVTNTMANAEISLWKDAGWENDRYWRISSSASSNSSDWFLYNYCIRRNIANNLTEEELANLQDIFDNYLYWANDKEANRRRNNLAIIRNSEMVQLFDNQFVASGDPLILTPVQTTSSEAGNCDLYYYYYNPADVQGDEVQYIKNLPKFMAIAPWDLMDKNNNNPVGSAAFFKKSEYVLPYYGDAPCIETTTLDGYTTDGKVYRIGNAFPLNDEDYYMIYQSDANKRLATQYEEDNLKLPFQMWQIFSKTENGNTYCYLYNVGAHCFLDVVGDWNTGWTQADVLVKTNDNKTTTTQFQILPGTAEGSYKFKPVNSGYKTDLLGADLGLKDNKGIWSDKNDAKGKCDWYLDEYKGSWDFSKSVKTELKQFSGDTEKAITVQSFTIPKGYKVGFLLKKARTGNTDPYNYYYNDTYKANNNGDLYGDGRLNTQINRFPNHFLGNANRGIIAEDDPRIACFSANGKSYLTFEEGSDANYVDMIIEVSNGVEIVEETPEPEAEKYTLCFEDRPAAADYDLNDVVLRCVRKDKTTLELSLVATGANDDVVIRGAEGWAYNDQEVHEIFNYTDADANGNRFINTVKNGVQLDAISAEVTVDENTSIVDYLSGISIKNMTTGQTVNVATTGNPPFGIIVPIDFQYPQERVAISSAYLNFAVWARDMNSEKNWYLTPAESETATEE